MRQRKLKFIFAILTVFGVISSIALPALASGTWTVNVDGRGGTGTDPLGVEAGKFGDNRYSPNCVLDDRNPDPHFGIPATGVTVGNCDQYVGQTDVTNFSLRYVDNHLLDPRGNNGAWDPVIAATGSGWVDDPLGKDLAQNSGDEGPIPTAKVPGFEAKITVAEPLPTIWHTETKIEPKVNFTGAGGSATDAPLEGLLFQWMFRNPELERNDLWAACERNTSLGNGDPNNPATKYLYSPYGGHFEDQRWLFISFKVTYDTAYRGNVTIGYYDASIDGEASINFDHQNNTVYNPYGLASSKDMFYGWNISADKKTITLNVPAIFRERNSTCKPVAGTGTDTRGYAEWPFARQASEKNVWFNPGYGQWTNADDEIRHVAFAASRLELMRLPCVDAAEICGIPLSRVPLLGEDDITWLIGFYSVHDYWTKANVEQYLGGFLGMAPQAGISNWNGPTCDTPTFGDTVPRNPLRNPGQPCALMNPWGTRHYLTGANFSV